MKPFYTFPTISFPINDAWLSPEKKTEREGKGKHMSEKRIRFRSKDWDENIETQISSLTECEKWKCQNGLNANGGTGKKRKKNHFQLISIFRWCSSSLRTPQLIRCLFIAGTLNFQRWKSHKSNPKWKLIFNEFIKAACVHGDVSIEEKNQTASQA